MKKILLVLIIMASLALSARADGVSMRSLRPIVLSEMEAATGTLGPQSAVLSDTREGCYGTLYKVSINQTGTYIVALSGTFDTYLFLFDSDLNEVAHNDDKSTDDEYDYHSIIERELEAGDYYILVTSYYKVGEEDGDDGAGDYRLITLYTGITTKIFSWMEMPSDITFHTVGDGQTETDIQTNVDEAPFGPYMLIDPALEARGRYDGYFASVIGLAPVHGEEGEQQQVSIKIKVPLAYNHSGDFVAKIFNTDLEALAFNDYITGDDLQLSPDNDCLVGTLTKELKSGEKYYLFVGLSGHGQITVSPKLVLPLQLINDVSRDNFDNLNIDHANSMQGQFDINSLQCKDNELEGLYLHPYKINTNTTTSVRVKLEGDESVKYLFVYKENSPLRLLRTFERTGMPFVFNYDDYEFDDEFVFVVASTEPSGSYTLSVEPSGMAVLSMSTPIDVAFTTFSPDGTTVSGTIDNNCRTQASGNFDSSFVVGYSFQTEEGKFYTIAFNSDNEHIGYIALRGGNPTLDCALKSELFFGTGDVCYVLCGIDASDYTQPVSFTLSVIEGEPTLNDYYISATGSDDNDGRTPQTPMLTLHKAIATSHGIGRYNLMSDITITEDFDNGLGKYAVLKPYQSDVTILLDNHRGFDNNNILCIGDEDGIYRTTLHGGENLYFILPNTDMLKMNYTTVEQITTNKYGIVATNADIRHCSFKSNYTGAPLCYSLNKMKISNSSFFNNNGTVIANSVLLSSEDVSTDFQLIDDTITNNIGGLSAIEIVSKNKPCKLYIDGGVLGSNSIGGGLPLSGNIGTSMLGNILVSGNVDITFGPRFSMERTDYVLLSDMATVSFDEKPAADKVCTIVPVKVNLNYDLEAIECNSNYREGLPVMGNGGRYRSHISVSQLDNGITWYIANNGTLTATDPGEEPEPEGISDIATASLALYPNPATTLINLDCSALAEAHSVRIVSMLGQTMMEQPAQQSVINVITLPAGIYMLQVTNDGGKVIAARRFAKQ